MLFRDRYDAGRQLASRLRFLRGEDVVVLGIPHGGVAVAAEVASALHAPLDVVTVRRLGLPYQPDLPFGTIGEGGVQILDDAVIREAALDQGAIAAVKYRERQQLSRAAEYFRRGGAGIPLTGRTVVIVDDGIAGGDTARTACRVARSQGAARVVLAVPVAARDASKAMEDEADLVICLETSADIVAAGRVYRDLRYISDDTVADLLDLVAAGLPLPQPVSFEAPHRSDEEIRIVAGAVELAGCLTMPENARGVVISAHSSARGRLGPRNRRLAAALQDAGMGTLLLDLLHPTEEIHRANTTDIDLLATRLIETTGWLSNRHSVMDLPIGYLGAGTAAAAALVAAADPRLEVSAVVSHGGRPDLADPALDLVHAPTLFIVGGDDPVVLGLNQYARQAVPGETELAVVPDATHLFAEPGALEIVAALTSDWFIANLGRPVFRALDVGGCAPSERART
ncbi:phosphoribosyltransferase family protein [Nocardia sp. BMG111209]|uniref:phosphoribosyltransferase family protein n=1 Tax=Nocardia sp. BMG111209 TaxID=1160137 RepID=UPI00036338F4|nr:phosphoribosyltransferase family protein [Nocardia sp. BMG111209]